MSESARSSSDQKASDLVRVRDNQRRSRARKKEYVQELESKWRNCEQTGAEASAEIQALARKVADENKRLRQLLQDHGISDRITNSPQSMQARDLDSMLGARRRCGGPAGGVATPSTPILPSMPQEDVSRQPTPYTNLRPAAPAPLKSTQDGYSPVSAYSSSSNGIPPNLQVPIYTGNPNHPTISQQQPTTGNGYYHSPVQNNSYEGYQPYQFSAPDYVQTPIPGSSETSSCREIAEAIRYVRPNLRPDQLEAQMGCREGQECSISNVQAFDLMDRLSDGRDQ